MFQQGERGQSHDGVHHQGTEGSCQDGKPASHAVGQRPIDQKRHTVNNGAHHEDVTEIGIAHEGRAIAAGHFAKSVLADLQIVATHIKESIGQAQGQPVGDAPAQVFFIMADIHRGQKIENDAHHGQENEDGIEAQKPQWHGESPGSLGITVCLMGKDTLWGDSIPVLRLVLGEGRIWVSHDELVLPFLMWKGGKSLQIPRPINVNQ